MFFAMFNLIALGALGIVFIYAVLGPMCVPMWVKGKRCVRCMYEVVGLPPRRRCPECGLCAVGERLSLASLREVSSNRIAAYLLAVFVLLSSTCAASLFCPKLAMLCWRLSYVMDGFSGDCGPATRPYMEESPRMGAEIVLGVAPLVVWFFTIARCWFLPVRGMVMLALASSAAVPVAYVIWVAYRWFTNEVWLEVVPPWGLLACAPVCIAVRRPAFRAHTRALAYAELREVRARRRRAPP